MNEIFHLRETEKTGKIDKSVVVYVVHSPDIRTRSRSASSCMTCTCSRARIHALSVVKAAGSFQRDKIFNFGSNTKSGDLLLAVSKEGGAAGI